MVLSSRSVPKCKSLVVMLIYMFATISYLGCGEDEEEITLYPCQTSWAIVITLDVRVMGDYAYVSSIGAGADDMPVHLLEILDISQPNEPKKTGEACMPGPLPMCLAWIAKPGVHATDSYVYMPSRTGLYVIDISDPQTLGGVGNVEGTMQTGGIYVSGKYAYIVAQEALLIVDISNPRSPNIVGEVKPTLHDRLWDESSIHVRNHYAYVATMSNGLYVISVIDPGNPEAVGNVGYSGMSQAKSVRVVDNYAYVVGAEGSVDFDELGRVMGWDVGGGLLQVIDISNPQSPTIVGSLADNGSAPGFLDVFISGSYAYVVGSGGLQVIDISDPENPRFSASADIQMFAGGENDNAGIDVKGGYAYMTDGMGLQVVDISNPEQPRVAGSFVRSID